MFGAYAPVARGAVLEVVAVSVLHEVLPLGGHVCRSLAEVIFRAEVVLVVGTVYPLNVIPKLLERFSIPVLIDEGRECLVEFMIITACADAGGRLALLRYGLH